MQAGKNAGCTSILDKERLYGQHTNTASIMMEPKDLLEVSDFLHNEIEKRYISGAILFSM